MFYNFFPARRGKHQNLMDLPKAVNGHPDEHPRKSAGQGATAGLPSSAV
jgi:hypothetical protein